MLLSTIIAIKFNLTELLHFFALIVPTWPLVVVPQFVCVVHIVHGAPAHWLPPPLARIGQLPKARLANQGKQGIELKPGGRWTLNEHHHDMTWLQESLLPSNGSP